MRSLLCKLQKVHTNSKLFPLQTNLKTVKKGGIYPLLCDSEGAPYKRLEATLLKVLQPYPHQDQLEGLDFAWEINHRNLLYSSSQPRYGPIASEN